MSQILYILFAFCCMAQTAFSAEITLLPNPEVSQAVIRLGDIAEFDLTADLAEALASVTVSQAPAPGERLTMRSIDIKSNLIKTNKVPANLSWQGPGSVTVYRKGVEISADRVQEIITEYLKQNRTILPDAKISFIPQSLPLPFVLPLGKLVYEVIPSHPAIIGSSRFSIIFKVDDNVVKNMSVRGTLEAIGKVVVAATSLKRGTILETGHLSVTETDISNLSDSSADPAEFIGKKLLKSVSAGAPISPRGVEALPVVYRGQKVKIVLSTGTLFLTATGLAHSDGRLEEMIRVQNLSSNKILYCRVAAPGLVEVML